MGSQVDALVGYGQGRISVTHEGSERTLAGEENNPNAVKVNYVSRQQLMLALVDNRETRLEVRVPDAIDMVAELKGVTRAEIIHTAVSAWIYRALGYVVLEAECFEQQAIADAVSGLLLIRVRLDADYESEVSRLKAGEEMTHRIRSAMVSCLLDDLVANEAALDKMIQISWVKGGSLAFGGVVSLSLVALVVTMLTVSAWQCKPRCDVLCCCGTREGKEDGLEYANLVSDLRERGALFEVRSDGSAQLNVPPFKRGARWRCPECSIL